MTISTLWGKAQRILRIASQRLGCFPIAAVEKLLGRRDARMFFFGGLHQPREQGDRRRCAGHSGQVLHHHC